MQFNKTTAGLLAMTLAAFLMGCEAEQTEKDMLAEAQFCLDKATAANASACMSKIQGLTSPQAYALRCAEGFITAGVTSPQNLADAMTSITTPGQATTAMLSALSFGDTSAANTTFNNCSLSNQSGLALIGTMAKSATILTNATSVLASCGTGGCDAAELASGITNLLNAVSSNDTSATETVVEIVSSVETVYTTTCSGAASANTEICGQFDAAASAAGVDITNMTSEQKLLLGQELLTQWQQPAP